ncbi:TPA: hypothetical protein QCZ00_003963 [Bacillus cereus]|uniref:hypothetical protein n=1 Tax=Bacillus cereus group sp. BfR-BA-01700 TaxID=3094884 RepID=UPI0029C41496|nr:hypothetical protein [Bacillus cereus group sp. BfR-BA-01700]MDX5841175.1 hypothetical protein [Bacillus cereus group sp. BfR-BA-01700]HDR8076539.1 hypothetical protein [Bacillus cereus]
MINKLFIYDFGKVAVTLSEFKVRNENMNQICHVDITECSSVDDTSTMDEKELGKYIEFLQEVRKEMIQIDEEAEGESIMYSTENGVYEITKLLAESKRK